MIYNCYYLMELENDSWLCVYFDDYLALTGVGDFRLAMYQHGKVNWLLDVMLQIATFSCCHEGVGYRPF